MTSTLEARTTTMTAGARRDVVRALIGRKTPDEIRSWASADANREWALQLADRLAASGFLTLSDVTDSEFDTIIG